MEETCGPKGDNWGSHVAARDDLYPENICYRAPIGERILSTSLLSKEVGSTLRLVDRAEISTAIVSRVNWELVATWQPGAHFAFLVKDEECLRSGQHMSCLNTVIPLRTEIMLRVVDVEGDFGAPGPGLHLVQQLSSR